MSEQSPVEPRSETPLVRHPNRLVLSHALAVAVGVTIVGGLVVSESLNSPSHLKSNTVSTQKSPEALFNNAATRELASVKAKEFTTALYDTKGHPKGVAVPGLLNGSVKINIDTISGVKTGLYTNPVVLVESHPGAKPDLQGKFLDGSWIAIPGSNARGQVVLTPVQIHLGKHAGADESLILNDPTNTVLSGAAIYTTTAPNTPDLLMGFDAQGVGNFPSVPIESLGMK